MLYLIKTSHNHSFLYHALPFENSGHFLLGKKTSQVFTCLVSRLLALLSFSEEWVNSSVFSLRQE